LVDLVREREVLISTIPSKWVLGMFGDTTPFYRKGHAEVPELHPESYTYVFVTAKATKEMAENWRRKRN